MICSKCNSEIPDSSKFCTNCGATVSAPADNKQFCENCGLELPKGAKFCAVCGAPVNKGASAEVKPFADVLEPVKLGAPISASAEMISAKTEELSENSVSEVIPAENVESGYSIPIPTSDTSMPAIDKAEAGAAPAPASKEPWGNEGELLWQASENKAAAAVSEPTNLESSEMGFIPESNYNETAAGYSAAASYSAPVSAPAPEAAPAPTYTAPQTNPMENPFGDYGMGAAAVAVKPVKKKSIAKYILIPVLSLIGAALIAAGVIFFVNRSLFFNIILGNSGYAAMVEGNSIKEVTSKIDMGALSDGIKRATTRSSGASAGMITGMGGAGYGIVPTSSSYGFSNSVVSGIDAKAMVESVKAAMEKSFGANSVKISTNFNVELTDSFKAQIASLLNCDESNIDEIVKKISGISYIVDITADEKAFECGMEMTADGLKLNAKSIVDENGNVYLMLPFVSDKAFMVNIGTASASQAGQVNSICLELDEKELKRITEKLVNVYLDVYKSCEIKIENGEVNVAGAIAKGKHITVNFTGAKMAELIQKTLETIVNDDYLCGKIVKFANDCGVTVTQDQLKSTVKNSSGSLVNLIPSTSGIVIETVTDNSCRVIAKSYNVISGGISVGKASFAGDFDASTKNGKAAAIAVEANEKPLFTLYLEKTSDTDGNCNIAVYNGGEKISLTAKYSEVKEATFCGKPITEGKIEFGIDLPSDFTENTESFGDISSVLSTMKVVVSVKADGDSKLVTEFALDAPQYAKIAMTSVVTPENKTSGISVPSDVMDFTEITKSMDEIPDDMKEEIVSYLKDMKNAVKSQNAGELGNSLVSGLEEIIRTAENGPSADRNDITQLMSDISDMKREVLNFDVQYNNTDEILSARAKALVVEIEKLISNITLKGFNMTENEFASFKSDFNRLSEVKESLEKEFAAGTGQSLGFGTKADNVDFTGLDIDSLTVILLEYASRYDAALGVANSALGGNTGELNALLSDAEEKYKTAGEDFENLYDLYNSGTLNLSFLRKSRKSTRAFAYAVEALENALGSTV